MVDMKVQGCGGLEVEEVKKCNGEEVKIDGVKVKVVN